MGKRSLMAFSVFAVTCGLLFSYAHARAEIDWEILKQLRIREKLMDADASLDGQSLYILVEGKLIIYSLPEARGKYSITVNKTFNRLKVSEADESIILLSTSENLIEIIRLQFVQRFDFSGSPFHGSAAAPVTIYAFIDYQCQPCTQIMPLLHRIMDQYKDKVKIVWKNFPSPGDELSFKAAIAVLAASEQNEFAAYQHMLLSESAKLDEVRLRTLAVELGLNMEKFDLDMKSPILLGIINRDIGEAIQAGVLTTPAIFINGKTVEDISFTGLQELIEAEIEEKKQPRVEQGNTTN